MNKELSGFSDSILKYISKNQFSLILISIIFFFAWSDLLINSVYRIPDWLLFSEWILIIGGLATPIVLLIGAVQYKSPLAFGVTLAIFTLTIFTNLSALPFYIQEYKYQLEFGSPRCSCCPLCEIRSIAMIVVACAFAIYLMNRQAFMKAFRWERRRSLRLMAGVLLAYLLLRQVSIMYQM